MARRALLIGSETHGLTGCDADVELMEGILAARGFDDVETLTGNTATRDGIVRSFAALIESTSSDDAVVVYFSGHGGRQPHPDWEARQAAGLSPYLQYIVPWDIDASTESEFKGLLAEELSEFQWQLTARTKNVTTILDCCHAGYMARTADLVPKAISRTFPTAGTIVRLAAVPEAHRTGGTHTNPDAIRIVACQPDQSAFERRTALGGGATHGVLTEALATVLDELGQQEISWAMIGDLVRRKVLADIPQQRPEVEGPAARLPFSLTSRPRPYAVPFVVDDRTASIGPASILGISEGDSFRLLAPDGIQELGAADVVRIDSDRAILSVQAGSERDLGASGEAVPLSQSTPRSPVALLGSGPTRDGLARLVGESPRLREAANGDTPFASITTEDRPVVTDAVGLRVHAGDLPSGDEGGQRAVELVELMAAAERLRALSSGQGAAALDQTIDLVLARHENGLTSAVTAQGERLFVGDRLSLRLENRGAQDAFVWLFDIGVAGEISLITNASPSGLRMTADGTPGSALMIGGQTGTAVSWPGHVPTVAERPETFIAIVADRQQDLRSLTTAKRAKRAAPEPASPLDSILDEYRTGVREWDPQEAESPLRYRIERIDFFLVPRARPRLDEPVFEVDDRPNDSVRAFQPRAAQEPPRRLAVRLTELLIRRNRALFRSDIRVDTLVVTRGADGETGVADARTFRFKGIGDAEHLPMDDVLLYHGEVRDFIELAIWINRDKGVEASFVDLLAGELSSDEVKGALTVLGGLALAGPQVAVGVAAVAAVATLMRVGARLIETATGNQLGTYRTSKLAFERFGEGRTPPSGRRQAQDVEFAYEVVEVR